MRPAGHLGSGRTTAPPGECRSDIHAPPEPPPMSTPEPSSGHSGPASASLLAVLAMLGWGASYVPSAWLVETWPPLLSAAARIGVGGLIIVVGLALLRRPVMPTGAWGIVIVLALTQSVLFYGATFIGIADEGAGVAAVLANTDPLFVALLAALVLGERLSPRQWLGLAVGLLGATVVVWKGPVWPPDVSLVSLIVVGGALAWAVGTVAVAGRIRAGARPVAIAGWQMLAGGAVLAVIGLGFEGVPASTGGREVGLILLVGLIGSTIPFILFYMALGRAPAGAVSAWFFLVPVIGVLTAWPLLGEEPGGRLWAGLVLVCLGLWMVLAPPRRPAARW